MLQSSPSQMFLRFLATPMLSIKNEGKYVGTFYLRGKDFKTQSAAFPEIVWRYKKIFTETMLSLKIKNYQKKLYYIWWNWKIIILIGILYPESSKKIIVVKIWHCSRLNGPNWKCLPLFSLTVFLCIYNLQL